MDKRRQKQRYLSYLLRLWQTSDGGKQVWHASLENPGSGERRGFASLEDLIGFLQAQTRPGDEEMRSYDSRGGAIL
jgi:hypothetical protein